jgi:NAD-dependent dihydropyrimidine dehydrogenase PreA subunit
MRRYSVINEKCTKDLFCLRACLRKAIHPLPNEAGFAEARQLFIDTRRCIGCGACISACEKGAIHEFEQLPAVSTEISCMPHGNSPGLYS